MPVGRAFCTLPSFVRSKRPRWRPVELNDRHLRSQGKIGDCEQKTSNWMKLTNVSLPTGGGSGGVGGSSVLCVIGLQSVHFTHDFIHTSSSISISLFFLLDY